jgi:hypothetical protein
MVTRSDRLKPGLAPAITLGNTPGPKQATGSLQELDTLCDKWSEGRHMGREVKGRRPPG